MGWYSTTFIDPACELYKCMDGFYCEYGGLKWVNPHTDPVSSLDDYSGDAYDYSDSATDYSDDSGDGDAKSVAEAIDEALTKAFNYMKGLVWELKNTTCT